VRLFGRSPLGSPSVAKPTGKKQLEEQPTIPSASTMRIAEFSSKIQQSAQLTQHDHATTTESGSMILS
jgi:hypothetical protein